MHWMKSFIFCSFIMMLKVGADILANDESSHEISGISTTLTPIVLQMSTQHVELKHEQSSENKSDFITPSTELESKPEENNETLKESENNSDKKISSNKNNQYHTPNDVEVFEHKPGPTKEKQEEGPEADPEEEEAAAEEAAEAEPAAEEEAKEEEAVAEPEPETAAEEEAKEEDAIVEPEPAPAEEPKEEEKVETETETEVQPEDTNKEETPENDEKEMSNDEPAKEEDPAPHINNDPTTAAKDNQTLSCFSCTSVDDLNCHNKTTHQENCPKVNTGDSGKHNGCYTLYKADTNITMRGCVDDLAEDGLKYCLTNDKLCLLCYTNGCNNKLAPNTAAIQQLNIYSMIILNGFSLLIIEKYLFN